MIFLLAPADGHLIAQIDVFTGAQSLSFKSPTAALLNGSENVTGPSQCTRDNGFNINTHH